MKALNRATIALFLLALSAGAISEELVGEKHSIELNVEGQAHVVERYYYSFEHPFDFNEFLNTVERNGSSLLNWSVYDLRVAPHFGTDQTIANGDISFDAKAKQLKLEYDIVDQPFANKVREESRAVVWQIPSNRFNQYQRGSIFVIPAQTEISIVFPPSSEFESQDIFPNPSRSDSESVTWKGYLPSNQMSVEYRVIKPIAPTIDLQTVASGIMESPVNAAIAIAIIALAAYAYANRKSISQQIEDYIVAHSEIGEKESEEVEVETD